MKTGPLSPHPELFSARYQLYSPERISAIRKSLKETREDFAGRFFVSEDAIKKWEKGLRELPGPAARLMIAIEAEALNKRNEQTRILRRVIERNHKSLAKRFAKIEREI